MIVGQEKPSLQSLNHYGVLGMKWGKRKQYTGKQIYAARKELRKENKAYRVERRKVDDLKKGSKARAVGEKKLEQMHRDYLNNPARVAAARMTRGEKASSLLFASSGIGLAASLGAIATSSLVSRRIEAKQDANAYKNVKGRRKFGGYGSATGAMINAGAGLAAGIIKTAGTATMKGISSKAAANRAAAVSRTKAIGSTASKLKYAKKSKGAFKVTTLK